MTPTGRRRQRRAPLPPLRRRLVPAITAGTLVAAVPAHIVWRIGGRPGAATVVLVVGAVVASAAFAATGPRRLLPSRQRVLQSFALAAVLAVMPTAAYVREDGVVRGLLLSVAWVAVLTVLGVLVGGPRAWRTPPPEDASLPSELRPGGPMWWERLTAPWGGRP